jgi:hypothetical protein
MFQGLYMKKYEVKHTWKAKEVKLTKQLVEYCDDNFAYEVHHDVILKGVIDYLASESESQHDYSWFVAKCHKWLKRPKVKQVEQEKVEVPGKSEEEVFNEVQAWVKEDAQGFMRGFVQTHTILKGINSNLYKRVVDMVNEIVGKDSARAMFVKSKKPLTKSI